MAHETEAYFPADYRAARKAFIQACEHAHVDSIARVHPSIAAPDGSRVAQAGLDEALIVGELDRQLMVDSRAANRYLSDRRPELYDALNKR
jgi:predicted amidohydrolase